MMERKVLCSSAEGLPERKGKGYQNLLLAEVATCRRKIPHLRLSDSSWCALTTIPPSLTSASSSRDPYRTTALSFAPVRPLHFLPHPIGNLFPIHPRPSTC